MAQATNCAGCGFQLSGDVTEFDGHQVHNRDVCLRAVNYNEVMECANCGSEAVGERLNGEHHCNRCRTEKTLTTVRDEMPGVEYTG